LRILRGIRELICAILLEQVAMMIEGSFYHKYLASGFAMERERRLLVLLIYRQEQGAIRAPLN
jgi:hypothetical protein